MLRISVRDEGELTSFTIDGSLTAELASELEQCWQPSLERQPTKSIVVRLAAVSFVDSKSRELLTRMRQLGVKLVPTGCLMRAIVELIESEVTKNAAVCSHRPT